MDSVAIITARGGSKRIPRKNIKDFCGRPIIAYSIEAAQESNLFSEIMVSTDDCEISDIAKNYGANIPFLRSRKNSDDYTNTPDVILEVLDGYNAQGITFDSFCCIYPTAPFIAPDELREAYKVLYEDARTPSVVPVTNYDFPPQRAFSIDDNGVISYVDPNFAFARSQDLALRVHDCGRFYFSKTEPFLHSGSLVMPGTKSIYIPEKYVQDIDTEEDWDVAELKFKMLSAKEKRHI